MYYTKNFYSFIVIFYLYLNIFTSVFAQITWQKNYGWENGDRGFCIRQTGDGNYILVGDTDLHLDDDLKIRGDIILMKLNENGDTLWTKIFGGTYWDVGYSVLETTDGGYIILGNTDMYGPNSNEIYIIRTDVNGDTLWTKKHGRYNADECYCISATNDGGYIIAGETYSLEQGWDGSTDVYLVKIDSAGNKLWDRIYGGNGDEGANAVIQTSDSGFILAGFTTSFGNANGYPDIYIIKIDNKGDTLWTKTYGDTFSDIAFGILETNDKGFILAGDTGYLGQWGQEHNIIIIKIDPVGTEIWAKEYNMSYGDIAKSLQSTSDSGYIMVGTTIVPGSYAQALLMKINDAGDSLWTHTFGLRDKDEGYFGHQTTDGGYILTGFSEVSGSDKDILIIKTDQSGFVTSLNNPFNNYKKITFLLKQNYPNPFNQNTVITYQLPYKAKLVEINIYNNIGQKVKRLFKGRQNSGEYKVIWNGKDDANNFLSSGIYFCQILINNGMYKDTAKLILLR